MSKQFDRDEARTFIRALRKPAAAIRLRAFYHSENPAKQNDKGRKGGPEPSLIAQWQSEGRGIYVVINDGGDKDAEITQCRAIFCEWDNKPVEWQVTAWQELGLPEPSLQVATGGKSIHNYWIFIDPITPDQWLPLQARLLEYTQSDQTIRNLARVLRLPGTFYADATGTLTNKVAVIHNSEKYYTYEDLDSIIPTEEIRLDLQKAQSFAEYEKQDIAEIEKALNLIPAAVPKTKQYPFYRNLLWALTKACEEAGGSTEDAKRLMKRHSPLFAEIDQVAASSFNRINAASFWYWARKHGYRQPKKHIEPPAAIKEAKTNPSSAVNLPFRPLGFDRAIYYYLPKSGAQVISLTAAQHNQSHFLQLAELEWWANGFADEKGRIDWTSAANAVMGSCLAQGVYDPTRLRGRGAWSDAERSILHLGNRLVIDGSSYPITRLPASFSSYYFYENSKAIDGPGSELLSDQDAARIIELAQEFSWEAPASAQLLLGWIVLAPVCGALDWRPHIWLTGSAGTGKTTILKLFIKPLLGGMYEGATGGTTEAGLRGQLRSDAIPVVFDELEQNEQKDKQIVQNILALARIASSEGGKIYKGTATGGSNTFEIRSMFCVSSINVALVQRADLDRFCVLPLSRNQRPRENWDEFEQAILDTCTQANGRRLIARTLKHIPIIRKNARTFATALARKFGQRFGDQHGTLLAGAWSLRPDCSKEVSLAEAQAWIEEMDWSERDRDPSEADEVKCLNHIIQYLIPVGGGRKVSIMELIQARQRGSRVMDDGSQEEIASVLGRYGIKVMDGCIAISNSSTNLQGILAATPWSGNAYKQALKRIPGATGSSGTIRFPGCGATRATLVPFETDETA
jgi:putative DNA primase/helicase